MTTPLNGLIDTQTLDQTQQIELAEQLRSMVSAVKDLGVELPPIADEILDALSLDVVPTLSAPVGPLSLDSLMQSIGDTVRHNAIQQSVDSIKQKGEERASVHDKQIENIQKQLAEQRKKSTLGIFGKIFKCIGIVLGAIASAATIALGAITANPVLIAAGALAAVSTVDMLVSTATDGKVSIAAGITKAMEAMGVDPEVAKWVGFGAQMLITVASVALSIGGAVVASSATITQATCEGIKHATRIASTATQIGSSVNGLASAGVEIGQAVVNNSIAKLSISNKELDVILERLRTALKMEEDLVEHEMEVAQALMAAVKDIVDGCASTQQAILTNSPSMA